MDRIDDVMLLEELKKRLEENRIAVANLRAMTQNLEAVNEKYTATRAKHDELEAEIRAMKDQREIKRANIERVNVEMASVDARVTGLLEKGREKFAHDFEPMLKDRSQFNPAEWENVQRDALDEMRRKLEEFGPVNMLAVSEHDEKKAGTHLYLLFFFNEAGLLLTHLAGSFYTPR